MSRRGRFVEAGSRLVVFREWEGVRVGGLMTSEYEVSFKDDENVPELDSVYGCTALWIYIFLKSPLNYLLQKGKFCGMWNVFQ